MRMTFRGGGRFVRSLFTRTYEVENNKIYCVFRQALVFRSILLARNLEYGIDMETI